MQLSIGGAGFVKRAEAFHELLEILISSISPMQERNDNVWQWSYFLRGKIRGKSFCLPCSKHGVYSSLRTHMQFDGRDQLKNMSERCGWGGDLKIGAMFFFGTCCTASTEDRAMQTRRWPALELKKPVLHVNGFAWTAKEQLNMPLTCQIAQSKFLSERHLLK